MNKKIGVVLIVIIAALLLVSYINLKETGKTFFASISETVIDDADIEFKYEGSWNLSAYYNGYYRQGGYRVHYKDAPKGIAIWKPIQKKQGIYYVYAWWPQGAANTKEAEYVVFHQHGNTTRILNQQANGSKWNLLGTFRNFTSVKLLSATDGDTIADAIKFEEIECVPECKNKQCDDDACGGICGTCNEESGETCNEKGQCIAETEEQAEEQITEQAEEAEQQEQPEIEIEQPPQEAEISFWQKIIDFFKGIFS